MLPTSLRNRNIMQLCWVVPDLKAAVESWVKTQGVGPFFWFEQIVFDEPLYRGKAAEPVNVSAAMAQAGDVQIELVCQHDDRPSFWRDLVPAGKSGFHHVAIYVDDYDAEVGTYLQNGAQIAFSGKMMGSPVCWIEANPSQGFMVEVITKNPVADAVFGQIRAAGQNWDGKDPIRTLG